MIELFEGVSTKVRNSAGTGMMLMLLSIFNDAYATGFEVESGPAAGVVAVAMTLVAWYTSERNPSPSARETIEAEGRRVG